MAKVKATVKNTGHGEEHSHPAFGILDVTQVHTPGMAMFGTNIEHSDVLQVTISNAHLWRSNNTDKFHSDNEIVSFYMTRQQFASLAAGVGGSRGVPCTLRWMRGEGGLPQIAPETQVERFSKDAQKEFKELARQIEGLVEETRTELTAAKVSKVRQEAILAPMILISRKLSETLPYLQSVFYETVEEIVTEAKAVVEAYAESRGIEEDHAPRIGKSSGAD